MTPEHKALVAELEKAAQWDDSPSELLHEAIAAIESLYASPQPANPAQVTDAMVTAFIKASSTAVGDTEDCVRAGVSAAIGAGGQAEAEPTGFIDHHRQKFASVEKHDAKTLLDGGWTPVYLACPAPAPVPEAGEAQQETIDEAYVAAVAQDKARWPAEAFEAGYRAALAGKE